MVGWKRIVVTVGEKIRKQHLRYAEAAAAEITALATIGTADYVGLRVSTTHALVVRRRRHDSRQPHSGIQLSMVRALARPSSASLGSSQIRYASRGRHVYELYRCLRHVMDAGRPPAL